MIGIWEIDISFSKVYSNNLSLLFARRVYRFTIMSNEMRYNVKSSQFLISQLHTESGPVLNFVWIKYSSIK